MIIILQTVLIHSACGGVGLAAIRVCEYMGATVDTPYAATCMNTDTLRSTQQSAAKKKPTT
jgi:NADPH:quinone reductase-like Zn-dependent oxidoreductase